MEPSHVTLGILVKAGESAGMSSHGIYSTFRRCIYAPSPCRHTVRFAISRRHRGQGRESSGAETTGTLRRASTRRVHSGRSRVFGAGNQKLPSCRHGKLILQVVQLWDEMVEQREQANARIPRVLDAQVCWHEELIVMRRC